MLLNIYLYNVYTLFYENKCITFDFDFQYTVVNSCGHLKYWKSNKEDQLNKTLK